MPDTIPHMIGENLHICVCIKETVSATNAPYNPKAGAEAMSEAKAAINPFDEYAVEEAVRIKERLGGKAVVSVLSMGSPHASEILKEAISRGADAGYLLSDPAFKGSDTHATSYVLSQAVQKISKEKGPVDLVLCGKQTNDSDTGQVSLGLAAWLDLPSATFIKKVEEIKPAKEGSAGTVTAHRMSDGGVDVLELDLPALLSVVKEINEPRIASLKGKMNAKKAEIPKWGVQELGLDAALVGEKGSLWSISEPVKPPQRSGGEKIEGADAGEKARNLLSRLKELGLI